MVASICFREALLCNLRTAWVTTSMYNLEAAIGAYLLAVSPTKLLLCVCVHTHTHTHKSNFVSQQGKLKNEELYIYIYIYEYR